MIGLWLAAALGAAPGCPAALARADALADAELARQAPVIALELESAGAGGPVLALRGEATLAGGAGASARPAAGARFRAALARHCALASQAAPPAPRAEDRARAERILDDPAFRRARADPEVLRRWLLAGWERLLELLETGEAQRYAAFSRTVFLAAVAAAAAVAVLALRRRRGGRPRPAPIAPDLPSAAPDARLLAAEAAAARGEAAQAIRLAMLAAVAALERDGEVPPGRALTNQELVARLGPAATARAAALRSLARAFDRTVYGGLPADAGAAAAALQSARTLGAGDG